MNDFILDVANVYSELRFIVLIFFLVEDFDMIELLPLNYWPDFTSQHFLSRWFSWVAGYFNRVYSS